MEKCYSTFSTSFFHVESHSLSGCIASYGTPCVYTYINFLHLNHHLLKLKLYNIYVKRASRKIRRDKINTERRLARYRTPSPASKRSDALNNVHKSMNANWGAECGLCPQTLPVALSARLTRIIILSTIYR